MNERTATTLGVVGVGIGGSLGIGGAAVFLGNEPVGQAVQTAAIAGVIAALMAFGVASLSDGSFVGD